MMLDADIRQGPKKGVGALRVKDGRFPLAGIVERLLDEAERSGLGGGGEDGSC